MAADVTEIQLEPSWVYFGASGSEVQLGYTDGPITINFGEEDVDVVADQTGKTPLDKILVGQNVTVKCSLKQWSLSNLAVAFPNAVTAASGIAGGRLPGWKRSAASGVLILHPTRLAASATTADFKLLRAVCRIDGDITLAHDQAKTLPIVFSGLPDIDKLDDGDAIWEYGTYT